VVAGLMDAEKIGKAMASTETPPCFTNFVPISQGSRTAIFVGKNVKLVKSSVALFLFQVCHNLLATIVPCLRLATARQGER
jgi:hypothetical protein